jgi:poly(hydroxyalkanoate) granule-associated protein
VPTKAAHIDAPADLVESAQQIWLAGLGVLTLAHEESGKLFSALVDAGKQIEKVMPSPIDALRTASDNAEGFWHKVQQLIDQQISTALHRFGVPTRDEIDRLTRRIEQLTASIEALRMRS